MILQAYLLFTDILRLIEDLTLKIYELVKITKHRLRNGDDTFLVNFTIS